MEGRNPPDDNSAGQQGQSGQGSQSGQSGQNYGGGYSNPQQGGQYPQQGQQQYPQQGYGQQQPPPPQYPQYQQPTQPQYQQPQQQQPQYQQPQYQQQPTQPQYQQYPQQYQQYPTTNYNAPPKKRTGLILGLTGLLLALIGGGILLFFMLQPKNGNVAVNTSPTATSAPGETRVARNTPVTEEEPTQGTSTNNGGGDNADLLIAASENMRNLRSYRLDADITSDGQSVQMRGELDRDNNSMRLDMVAAGQEISVIAVDDVYYVSSDGGQTYTEAPEGSGAQLGAGLTSFNEMWESLTANDIERARDALKDGSPATENIDGDDTKHMTGDMADLAALSAGAGSDGSAEGTIDIWVTTDGDNYVRQMVIDGTSSGQTIQGTMKWSEFNEDFNITAP